MFPRMIPILEIVSAEEPLALMAVTKKGLSLFCPPMIVPLLKTVKLSVALDEGLTEKEIAIPGRPVASIWPAL